jgi:hypothetical protein
VIRQKLSRALGGWHPSDRSARLVLLPWVGVFPRGDMDAFLVKHIVPKLTAAMHELVVNPHQQHLGEWEEPCTADGCFSWDLDFLCRVYCDRSLALPYQIKFMLSNLDIYLVMIHSVGYVFGVDKEN